MSFQFIVFSLQSYNKQQTINHKLQTENYKLKT